MSDIPDPSPEQLQWILDHNEQIRAGHRYRLANMVKAWQADRDKLAAVRADVFAQVEAEAKARIAHLQEIDEGRGCCENRLLDLADWCQSQRRV